MAVKAADPSSSILCIISTAEAVASTMPIAQSAALAPSLAAPGDALARANPPALIEATGLTRIYAVGDDFVRALDDVSLTVEAGEFIAIVGASGSGKSTLMAILGCLDRPNAGVYRLGDRDVARATDAELAHIRNAEIGFVFQSFNLLPRTSAMENVAMPLDYREGEHFSREERAARARAALQLMGLGGQENRTPGRLSGGQQQRVAIARAIVNDPRLLLADEPTGNLDTQTSHEIMDKLTRLNRERGITIILVTHETDIAAYADRVITMRDGRIVEDRRKTRTAG